ncbi:MAG: permease-like cell division protein FtsX [bacterium]|nr:permease-like cell division protein FtsX [bacterium]MDT8396828.1 permease-like cell division protein FtsX [bacterium]
MSRLISSIGRALGNLRQSWLISSITVGIISICLFLVGGYLLLTHNLQGVLETWKQEVRITVYLRDGFPDQDVLAFQDRISSLPEVHSVAYISKEQALEEFTDMLGDDKVLASGLENNPLPASLRITLPQERRNMEGVKAVLPAIGDDPLVQDIQYGKEWLGHLDRVLRLLKLGSVVLGLALSLAAVFIISNTIKITVMARKDELEIMRMVGATEGFIRLPFLVEGIIQGLAGAAVSLGFLGAVHAFMVTRADQPLLKILHIESFRFLPPAAIAAILMGGMLLGGLGSLASVGRHSR